MLAEKVYLINLDIRPDRLKVFSEDYPKTEQLGETFERWTAVHGDTVTPPLWWRSGNGAWGCYRTHLQILEHCLNNRIESYVVFEDDACFRPGFEAMLKNFSEALPDNWEMIYLGGQLLHEKDHPPLKLNDHVYVPYNVNRTHCFGLKGRDAMLRVYHHLTRNDWSTGEHIDHHLGRLHETRAIRTYVPGRWLVGQRAGSSNISGRTHGYMWFADPETLTRENARHSFPTILLRAPREEAEKFFAMGWHPGFWRDEKTGYDHGIEAGVRSYDKAAGIKNWYGAVSQEVVSHGFHGLCCWHPEINLEDLQSAGVERVHEVIADTAERAELSAQKILEESKGGRALQP